MDRSSFQRVKELFQQALALDPADRAAFLERETHGAAPLRAEVEELLTHAVRAETGFLAGGVESAMALGEGVAREIPGFDLVERIAVGASSVVYRAEQRRPKREVALKLLRPETLSPGGLQRFKREAEILAALDHPGIAKVFDAGTVGDGVREQHWIAMQFVRGRTLDAHMRSTPTTVLHVLELVRELCDAVDHAHQRGVVHRDLKPSNVMIDEQGRVRVLDFGVARLTNEGPPAADHRTRTGHLVGTLAYMAPEQARGERAGIDARADVYAIGVLMFELLCARLPIEVDNVDLLEAVKRVSVVDPPHLRALRPDLSPDLEAIVAKCLEKTPERRYADAGFVARDIDALLSERPVLARRKTVGYVTRRFLARHRQVTAVAAALIVFLTISLGVSLAALGSERRQRELTSETLDFFAEQLSTLAPQLGFGIEHRGLLTDIERRIRLQLGIDPRNRSLNDALAQMLWELTWLDQTTGDYEAQQRHAAEAVAIRERMVEERPDDLETWSQLSQLCAKLGEAWRDRGNRDECKRWFERALEIDEELARLHPDEPEIIEDLGWSLQRVAKLAEQEGDLARARALEFRRLDEARPLVKIDPKNWKYAKNLSNALYFVAGCHEREGRREDALAAMAEAVEFGREASELEPRRRDLSGWLGIVSREAAHMHRRYELHDQAWRLANDALALSEYVAISEPMRSEHIDALRNAAEEFYACSQGVGDANGGARAALALQRVATLSGSLANHATEEALLHLASTFVSATPR